MRAFEARGLRARAATTIWVTVAPPESVRLVGRVVDEVGRGRGLVRVQARVAGNSFSRDQWTDNEGHFDLRGINPGEILLEADPRGFIPQTLALGYVGAGEVRRGLLLTLALGARLAGTLYLEGHPAEIVAVRAQTLDGQHAREMRTDQHGDFEFQGLPDGEWIVRSEERDKRHSEHYSVLGGPVQLRRNFYDLGALTLQLAARLELDIGFSSLGTNVSASLERHVPSTDVWLKQAARTLADPYGAGWLEVGELEPGVWRVSVVRGQQSGVLHVVLGPGEVRRESLRLAAPSGPAED